MSKGNNWIQSTKLLYKWSFFAWCGATAMLVVKPILDLLFRAQFIEFPAQPLILMGAAFPGVFHFYRQSKKLDSNDLPNSNTVFEKLMKLQNPTGIAALVGAVLGLIPFLVNFIGMFTILGEGENQLSHIWLNLNLMLPWVSLYGFVTTYIIALRINARRKRALEGES